MDERLNDTSGAGQEFEERQPPSEEDVRRQMERIFDSSEFRGSERLRDFLSFVVDATLEGDLDRIKAYTIAVEVFERGPDFDPQVDSIVRVEAGRLRRQLEHYYLVDGADDPVLIEVPKGGYAPRFVCHDSAPGANLAAAATTSSRSTGSATPSGRTVVAAIGLGVTIAFALWWILGKPDTATLPQAAEISIGVTRIMVMPFEYASDTDVHPLLNASLTNELITTLATLPEFELMSLRTAQEAVDQGLTTAQIVDRFGVDYMIQGNVRQQQSDVRVTLTIVDAATSIVRESEVFDGSFDRVFELQDEMAREFAHSVAAVETPAFKRRLRATKELDPELVALYYEATTLRDPPSDPKRSQLAEEAYRRVIELDPEFAGGYAGLAYVLAYRSWWKVSGDPQKNAEQALQAARTAVEKDPESGWAQMSLGLALNLTGDHDGALGAARRAAELARDDPYVLTFSALVQTFQGEVEAAIPLAEKAIRLDPLSARTPFRNILGAILFQAGRYQESIDVLRENVERGGPDGPHVAYWRAGSLAALGRTEEARQELAKAGSFPSDFAMEDFLAAFRDPEEGAKLLVVLELIRDV